MPTTFTVIMGNTAAGSTSGRSLTSRSYACRIYEHWGDTHSGDFRVRSNHRLTIANVNDIPNDSIEIRLAPRFCDAMRVGVGGNDLHCGEALDDDAAETAGFTGDHGELVFP